MKHFGWPLVAVSSVLLSLTYGATRPQYGGTAHILLRSAPNSLDPGSPQSTLMASANLVHLLYDTLVSIDDTGQVQPGLAVSWQVAQDQRHWEFQLRDGVKFDDGSTVSADAAAASLRRLNPWKILSHGSSLDIDLDRPDASLLAELALAKNAIVKAGSEVPRGTGPFRAAEWVSQKRLLLKANEEYWGGRPFLDAVEIEFGKSYREQEVALALGRADVIEIATEDARRLEGGGGRIAESAPLELLALVFSHAPQADSESKLRDALALCIDRATIRNVLLGGKGELAGGILPNWMSGYEFLFPSQLNVTQAQEERGEVNQAPLWTLGYNPIDAISQVVAERIALNAREVGLRVQLATAANADILLARIHLPSANAAIALNSAAAQLGLGEPKLYTANADALYEAEAALLATKRVVPLFHLPSEYSVGAALRGWKMGRDGSWSLADVWLNHAKTATDRPGSAIEETRDSSAPVLPRSGGHAERN
ncbi:MAG: ABC transporter substrate-binding protein [Acidobacteria bacterium]|nr:ABC transporter substrate-binding protein [Acidobacteriota bacterium]